jgi:hypothetical protein
VPPTISHHNGQKRCIPLWIPVASTPPCSGSFAVSCAALVPWKGLASINRRFGLLKSMKIYTSCKMVAISIHPHLFPLGPGFCQFLTALTGGAAAGVGAVGAGAPLAAGAGVLAAGMMQMSSQGAQLGPKSLGRKCGKNYEKL